MQYSTMRPYLQLKMEDTSLLRKKLQREINCLEIQLDRLHRRDDVLDFVTQQTYEEMIQSRRGVLDSL